MSHLGESSDSASPEDTSRALRVLDANFNRVSEGLRVLEDYTRLVLNDAFLSRELKGIRHALAALRTEVGEERLMRARDTLGDLGTGIAVDSEYDRSDLADIIRANQKRVEQSLRCLEEFSKLIAPQISPQVEQARYRIYTLAVALEETTRSAERLESARLYLLIDAHRSDAEFERHVTQLISAGVDVLQLRDKQVEDRVLVSRARALRRCTEGSPTRFIVNDRPDIALLSRADGVHIGQEELQVADVRSIVGSDMLIGVSTHNIQQARQAVLDGASYIGCGPTFPSQTKSFSEFPGLDFLREVIAEISLPAFAIGGIHSDNLQDVLSTGFYRVAVGAAINQAPDPAASARDWKTKMNLASGPSVADRENQDQPT